MDFKASNGWLARFQERHQITGRTISGESAFINNEVVENWKATVPTLIEGYELRNIFNSNETGLFWRGLPNKTLATRKDSCKGGKAAKERLTVLLTASVTGEKLPPLIIWKSLMPRCFNKSIPSGIQWYANKSVWMTSDIFEDYLEKLNERMRQENRNIILFLDNAPVHPAPSLSNVKLIFLPCNTTAETQPLDAEIIKNFKFHYRRLLLNDVLSKMDSQVTLDEMMKKMTVSQTIRWIKTSWYENIQASNISKCFASCGFPIVGDVPNNETIISEEDWTMLTETLAIEDPTYDEGDIEVFHTLGDEWEDEILHPVMEEIKSDEQEESESSDDEAIPAWKEMYENWNKFYIMYQLYSENELD